MFVFFSLFSSRTRIQKISSSSSSYPQSEDSMRTFHSNHTRRRNRVSRASVARLQWRARPRRLSNWLVWSHPKSEFADRNGRGGSASFSFFSSWGWGNDCAAFIIGRRAATANRALNYFRRSSCDDCIECDVVLNAPLLWTRLFIVDAPPLQCLH